MIFKKRFPNFRQLDLMDCGPASLKIITKHYGKDVEMEELRRLSGVGREGVAMGGLIQASSSLKMDSMGVQIPFKDFSEKIPLPCIVHWKNNHYVVVYKIDKNKVSVSDPAFGLIDYTIKDFLNGWLDGGNILEGVVLIIRPRADFQKDHYNRSKEGVFDFLFDYFLPYKKYLLQILIGIIVGSVIQLAIPFLTQSIVDYGINYDDINYITVILCAQLFLYLTMALIQVIRGWIVLHLTTRINIQIISDFLLRLMGMPISFFDSKNTGDFMQRINDHKRISNFISVRSIVTLTGMINILLFSIVLLYFSYKIFLIFIMGTGLYILWSINFLKRRSRLDYLRFEEESKNQSSILQIIRGIEDIKFNNSQYKRRLEWYKIQTKLFKVSIDSLRLKQLQINGGDIIGEIKNIVIIFTAATGVVSGQLTIGGMLAIMYIIGNLSIPVKDFIDFLLDFQDAKLSIARLTEINNIAEEPTSHKFTLETIDRHISFQNVHFSYKGSNRKPVLDGLDFEIPIGKNTAIVGESGSGKTTILKMLLRVYEPSKGTIKLDDLHFSSISKHAWRQNCGVVMQNGFIFNDTIKGNITESQENGLFDYKRYRMAISVANLEDFIESMPNGDRTKIGDTGVNLSGGEKQRILIARAVYKDPQFIFFDEATSSLDSGNESRIAKQLENYCKGKTVVTIAHRLSTVRGADQIIVLDKGKIIERGNHDALIAKEGRYYSLIKEQL